MDKRLKNFISSAILSIDYFYDHGVFLTEDGEFDSIYIDEIEYLKKYLTSDKYSILHCDVASDIIYLRKSILHDSQCSIKFLRHGDLFYLNKSLCVPKANPSPNLFTVSLFKCRLVTYS